MACSTTVSFSPPVASFVGFSGGADFGSCSGDEYVLLDDPSDCPDSCSGSSAYALCDGTSYSQCSCDIPTGWTIEGTDTGDGGFVGVGDDAGDDGGVDAGDDGGDAGADAGGDDGGDDSSADAGGDDSSADAGGDDAGGDDASADTGTADAGTD
jgi:hypothetical protein